MATQCVQLDEVQVDLLVLRVFAVLADLLSFFGSIGIWNFR